MFRRRSLAPERVPDDERRKLARRRRFAGQSIVEFAILLPVFLALVGMTIDFARIYQGWVNLEAATRDAAQYLATSNLAPDNDDYTVPGATANATNDAKAKFVLDTETSSTFTRSNAATLGACSTPTLTTVTGSTDTTASLGGSNAFPLQKAEVLSCMPFTTLFAYPFLTTNGSWILSSDRTYNLIVGR
jgi:Flp pilus assembly protein TadG